MQTSPPQGQRNKPEPAEPKPARIQTLLHFGLISSMLARFLVLWSLPVKMLCCKVTSEKMAWERSWNSSFREKIKSCIGGRLRPEGLFIVPIFYFGASRLHGEMSAAINMPCENATLRNSCLEACKRQIRLCVGGKERCTRTSL